ncbi:MAG: hypothetical protein HKN23_21360 [Verrucomicrobiales bacterium]|nr:hypothetical protein [Verrucomicrobiales bacterium]
MRFFPLLFLALPALAWDPATQDDSLALARHFTKPTEPLKPFADRKFEPNSGETITLMGGTSVFQMQDTGKIEAAIYETYPDKKLRIRNIGWPADTVYRQQRPMFFYTKTGDTREGSVPDQREKLEPGIFILQFGKMESLDGESRLPEFESALGRLVDELAKFSPRIVLIAPEPFPKSGPAAALAAERNATLAKYTDTIRNLAKSKELIFAMSLSGNVVADSDPGDALLAAIHEKNDLFTQYYRPTNWAFLFGDRQHVPSSRDHRDANRRWFIEELNKLPGLVSAADEAIWKEVQK